MEVFMKDETRGGIEVRIDAEGKLDEIVGRNVNVHIERMDDGVFWIGVYDKNKNEWRGYFTALTGPLDFTGEFE
jgi:hypothetical protein